jgi:hypothetical protein
LEKQGHCYNRGCVSRLPYRTAFGFDIRSPGTLHCQLRISPGGDGSANGPRKAGKAPSGGSDAGAHHRDQNKECNRCSAERNHGYEAALDFRNSKVSKRTHSANILSKR